MPRRFSPAAYFIILAGLVLGSAVAGAYLWNAAGLAESGSSAHGIPRKPLDSVGESQLIVAPRIVVRKSERKLMLYSGDKLVRTYRVGVGFNLVGVGTPVSIKP